MNVAYVAITVAVFVVRWLFIQLTWKVATTRYGTNLLERWHARGRTGIFCKRDRRGQLRSQQL